MFMQSSVADTATHPEKAMVVVYGTSWCPYCKRAREYLTSKNIEYTDYDIEKSEIGAQQYQTLNGRGVPLIMIGNTKIEGFNPEIVNQALVANGLMKP
jgi:glutaredoxin-like YruB-family protein